MWAVEPRDAYGMGLTIRPRRQIEQVKIRAIEQVNRLPL
jgi:hypothetical protein